MTSFLSNSVRKLALLANPSLIVFEEGHYGTVSPRCYTCILAHFKAGQFSHFEADCTIKWWQIGSTGFKTGRVMNQVIIYMNVYIIYMYTCIYMYIRMYMAAMNVHTYVHGSNDFKDK